MTLPSFLGVGALKAGTTTVHELLRQHPQVALPLHRKEVMFFDRYWDRGVAWYEQQFAHAGTSTAGEISPNYLFDPAVPARVASLLPEVRLFAVLRDPVARLYSQYRFFVKEQRYAGTVDDFIREHPNALERGFYARQLERWADHLPAEAMLVLLSDELEKDPREPMRRLLVHLGVDPAPAATWRPQRHNAAATPRSGPLWTAGRRAARWLYDRDLAWVVDRLRRTGLPRLLLRSPQAAPPFPRELQRRLRDQYADDVGRLGQRLGVDLRRRWIGGDA